MSAIRRLAAILAADVVGYSRLMGADEEGTLAALKSLRHELADPKINDYRGRIVKTTGDGLLVEFASAVDAVHCAVDMQRKMAERNSCEPCGARIEFRIGINAGDIIVDEDNDVFGDGVNVAARLEALAEPGGICVSRFVRDQLRGKGDLRFEDQGKHQLKNINHPVHLYRIPLNAQTETSPTRVFGAEPEGALPLPNKTTITAAYLRPKVDQEATDLPLQIVVVEDEAAQRQLLVDYLVRQNFRASGVDGGVALRRLVEHELPTLVLLDVGLPGEDGFALARWLREKSGRVGIIMVTAAADTIDRVVGLETGADDYIAKPFEPRELLARVKSVLRRAAGTAMFPAAGPRVRMGRRVLDLEKRVLVEASDGREEPLAASEFDLLKVFAENPNRPLMRDWLLEVTAHRDMDAFDRAIDLRITRLRRKIEIDPAHPETIRTVRGVGYMFVPSRD